MFSPPRMTISLILPTMRQYFIRYVPRVDVRLGLTRGLILALNLREICSLTGPVSRTRRDALKIRNGAVAYADAVVDRPCQAGRQQYVGRGELDSHEHFAAIG